MSGWPGAIPTKAGTMLIVLEGLDGSGKGTQTELLLSYLAEKGIKHRKLRFPDYDDPSSTLVKMYLDGQFGDAPGDVGAYAASAFYAVDRYASFTRYWADDYKNGTTLVCDRYTTSNAVHQTCKLPREMWDEYLDWLYDFEFCKLGIPRPDIVLYFDQLPEISARLIEGRYAGTDRKKDIHERDMEYLVKCREAGLYAARRLGWKVITCFEGDEPLPIEFIHGLVKDEYGHSKI